MKQQKKQLSIIQPACFHPHRRAYSTTTKVMWVTGGSGLAPWVTHPDMDVSGNGQYTHNSWQFTEWETYIISKKKVIPHSRRNSYWSLSWGAVGMPPALLITVYMVKPRHPRSLAQFFFSHHAFPWHRQQLRCSVLEHTDVDLTQKSWVWNIWIWEA